MRRLVIALPLLIAVSVNCYADACSGLAFESAWVREPPPVSKVAAGYVTVRNTTSSAIAITAIDSDCCKSAAMHDIASSGDQLRMVHMESAVVPAADALVFEPGARHLMLIGPRNTLSDGDEISIEFACRDGSQASVNFQIKRIR